MPLDPWLPVGFALPSAPAIERILRDGGNWQLYITAGNGRALLIQPPLFRRWTECGLLSATDLPMVQFGAQQLYCLTCAGNHQLSPIRETPSPTSRADALAFADALRATRTAAPDVPLADALYVERISRLLPTWGTHTESGDAILLGSYLSGGVPVSVLEFQRLRSFVNWLSHEQLLEILHRAGFTTEHPDLPLAEPISDTRPVPARSEPATRPAVFKLAGRPALENFFLEHVLDIIENPEQYQRLGIDFPGSIILHGPPGCGKTFAIERLVEYLGWPSFEISSSSIGSPFIHETSRKVAEVFDTAIKSAPSVLIIDEMEAFLADRESSGSSGHHRVEEVAEFLRRIPEANRNRVLIVAMTNRLEMIDSAIQRRGRFDHVIGVDFATQEEIKALLEHLLKDLPREDELELDRFSRQLEGRPLSDVAFLIRESARRTARAGKEKISSLQIQDSLNMLDARNDGRARNPIGFQIDT